MSEDNNLTNIRNVLGFLLAGFGAVLSFLGVRSSEVTTILRNDSGQASVIALILLVGVLTAIWAIITTSKEKIYPLSAAAIVVLLLGIGALVIFYIPIGQNYLTVPGKVSLAIGCTLVLAGGALLIRMPFLIDHDNRKEYRYTHARFAPYSRWQRVWLESGEKWQIELIDILIVTSVLLTGIAAYGAMRLESDSQLSFSSQVGASFSIDGSVATVSTNINATKLPQVDWIFVEIYVVPIGKQTDLENICQQKVVPSLIANLKPEEAASQTPELLIHCETDPCVYLNGQYDPTWPNVCNVLLAGSIVPNATGDINETLSTPFVMAKYQDIDVRAEVCSPGPGGICEGSPTGQNSRLDWIISNSQITPEN